MTLADEFVKRYIQLIHDGKIHPVALKLTVDEFKFQFIDMYLDVLCFYFLDKSRCDYVDNGWDVTGFDILDN